MALVVNDRVKETSTTTGTGTFSLAGVVSGFESFVAGIGNSNTTYYAIVNSNGEFEVGLGTVTDAAPDTLARTTIISSSNSDSAVNFSAGTKNVFCTLPASKAVILDASGNISANNGVNLTALNATQLTSGTVPDARFPATLPAANGSALTNLNATNLASGSVASARLADDSVTLAKMAPGTDGNIISYDTSGNPVAVATGSSGQILTSAGAGAPPTFSDPAGETNNICFRAGLTSGAVSLGTGGGYVTIPCNSEFFDQGGCYNNTGSTVTLNGLSAPAWSFCPNRAGKYLVFGGATMYYQNSTLRWGNIKIGGSATAAGNARSGHDSSANYGYSMNPSVSDIVQLNGTGNYVTISARGYAGGNAPEMEAGNSHCYFGAVFLTSN